MKFIVLSFILLSQLLFSAQSFSKQASVKPVYTQKGEQKQWCPICGMDIKKHYKTSHTSKLQNGRDRQYCSIHCLAVDMKEYDIDRSYVKVVDAGTQELIDANEAFYVLGSSVDGTMSNLSKLAFKKKTKAKEFTKKYGGKIITFNEALKYTKESLKEDIDKIEKIKAKKIYPMGEKIFKAKCKQDIDLTEYLEIHELKAAIVYGKICKPLKEKHLQALAGYLWEVKRFGDLGEVAGTIELLEDEKCPVCGMFTYKYPKWVAQIFYKHNGHSHHYSFDGVKDMMKFYFNPMSFGDYKNSKREGISKILVTDYYSQKAIDGTKAFYVIHSDVYGPMGDELIPFKNLEEAKVFKADHAGEKILKFDDIVEDEVYNLDQ